MPRSPKPDAPQPFCEETLLALTDEQYTAMALWSIVRRRRGNAWGADVERWSSLANVDPAQLERLLGIMQGGEYVTDDGELRPEVLHALRVRLEHKLTPPKTRGAKP